MALVAYDNSDSSDYEDDENEIKAPEAKKLTGKYTLFYLQVKRIFICIK